MHRNLVSCSYYSIATFTVTMLKTCKRCYAFWAARAHPNGNYLTTRSALNGQHSDPGCGRLENRLPLLRWILPDVQATLHFGRRNGLPLCASQPPHPIGHCIYLMFVESMYAWQHRGSAEALSRCCCHAARMTSVALTGLSIPGGCGTLLLHDLAPLHGSKAEYSSISTKLFPYLQSKPEVFFLS